MKQAQTVEQILPPEPLPTPPLPANPVRAARPAPAPEAFHTRSLAGLLPVETETIINQGTDQSQASMSLVFKNPEQDWSQLQVVSETPGRIWAPDEQMLVKQVVDQLTLALQNAQLIQQTERQNADLAVLNDFGNELVTLLGQEEILESVYKHTSSLMDTENFFVATYNDLTQEFTFPFVINDGKRDQASNRKLGNGLSDYVVRSKQPLFIPENMEHRMTNLGVDIVRIGTGELAKCWLGVPMLEGERIRGVIAVQSIKREHVFSERDRDLLMSIASQTAISLQNASLFRQTQEQNAELAILNEMGRELSAQFSLDGVASVVYAFTGRLMDVADFFISIYHPEKEQISFPLVYFDGKQTTLDRVDVGNGLTAKIIHDKIPVFLPDRVEERFRELGVEFVKVGDDDQAKCWLGVPLMFGETVLGTITVQSTVSENLYNEHHRDLLVAIAGQAAIALQKAQLFEETSKFKMGIERSGDAIFMTDLAGKIIYTNPAFTQIYGFTNEDALGKTPRILKSGLISQDNYQDFWKTLLSKNSITGEIINKTKDGRLVNIAGTNSPILDEKDEILGFLAVHHDITSTKQAEEAIRQSEQALQRQNEYLATAAEVGRLVTSTLDQDILFERTVDLIRGSFGFYYASLFTIDDTGFNAVLREGTGDAGEKMVQSGHSLAVGSRSIIGQVTATGKTIIVNNTAVDPLHRQNPLLPNTRAEAGIPLKIGDRVVGAIDLQSTETGAFKQEDISVLEILADQVAVALENARSYNLAQKAMEEMRETDRIKSQFLANMSHELRTPLNSIIGFSRVILKGIDGPINEQQQQDLSAIYNSGQHLLGLINDILDLSKIDAGKMELSFDEVNMADTIHSVMSTAVGLVKDKQIRLQEQAEPNLPAVRADSMRLRQVLLNLISNAAKFTDEGSIIVSANLHTNSLGKQEVMVSVTDSGPGISQEDQEKLFKPFSQVDASPTRKTGGTGLGLSISHRLVELHGGRIGIHSTVGKGSTFYFTVPVFSAKPVIPEVGDGKIILCVDDDVQVISLYDRYLTPQGYHVVALTDPTKAREVAKEVKPFAITLDIMMPGYDGWQVINDLKKDKATHDIPVIICSIVEEEEKGFSLGAADYLVKPILEEDLVNSLNRLNGDGSINEVLVIDDDVNDLRLVEKILNDHSQYKPILAEGGVNGWESLLAHPPQAIILDLFMPDLDGFTILERMRSTPKLRDIPVVVISGVDLTLEQRRQLENLGKRLLQKGMLNEEELFATLEKALNRIEVKKPGM